MLLASGQSWTKWPWHCWNKSLNKPFSKSDESSFHARKTIFKLENVRPCYGWKRCIRSQHYVSEQNLVQFFVWPGQSSTFKRRSSWKTSSAGGKGSHALKMQKDAYQVHIDATLCRNGLVCPLLFLTAQAEVQRIGCSKVAATGWPSGCKFFKQNHGFLRLTFDPRKSVSFLLLLNPLGL